MCVPMQYTRVHTRTRAASFPVCDLLRVQTPRRHLLLKCFLFLTAAFSRALSLPSSPPRRYQLALRSRHASHGGHGQDAGGTRIIFAHTHMQTRGLARALTHAHSHTPCPIRSCPPLARVHNLAARPHMPCCRHTKIVLCSSCAECSVQRIEV